MYCNKCGKEMPNDSHFCPSCGAKNVQEDSVTQNLNDIPTQVVADRTTTIFKKKGLTPPMLAGIVILATVIAFALVYLVSHPKITAESVTISQLYNTDLGVGLRLNTPKSKVDQLLGKPESYGDSYLYSDTYLYANYKNGKLISMYIEYPNDRWITAKNTAVETTTDDLINRFGEPTSIEHDDKWWYYTTGYTITGFEINQYSQDVMSIFIYDQREVS